MSWDVIGMLALVAFCAGFFDAIAGGGGLITLPALLLASVDPISAIATNKFQAASATISATVTFARALAIKLLSVETNPLRVAFTHLVASL
ncbi:hypothetical protein D3C76_566470 [compost metagenome]